MDGPRDLERRSFFVVACIRVLALLFTRATALAEADSGPPRLPCNFSLELLLSHACVGHSAGAGKSLSRGSGRGGLGRGAFMGCVSG